MPSCHCRGGPDCCMCKPRYAVVAVQLPKSGEGWGVIDRELEQVVNTGQSRDGLKEWAEAMNRWEEQNPASEPKP